MVTKSKNRSPSVSEDNASGGDGSTSVHSHDAPRGKNPYPPAGAAAARGAGAAHGAPGPDAFTAPLPPTSGAPPGQVDSGWRDVLFIAVFFAHLVGVGVVWGISSNKKDEDVPTATTDNASTYNGKTDTGSIIALLVGTTCVSALFGVLWYMVMNKHPMAVIRGSFFTVIGLWCAAAAYSFAVGAVAFGIIFLIAAAAVGLFMFFARKRFPFTAALLTATSTVINSYKGVFVVAFVALAAQIVWLLVWSACVSVAAKKSDAEGAYLYLLFSLYFTTQVISNVAHVTISGTVATWYFQMPATSPTLGAAKRALSTSFGSVCLGSLIIACVQFIRAVINMLTRNQNAFVRCIADCLLGCIENIVRMINKYAFTKVAMYGRSFCDSAKETFELFKSRGWDLIVSDDVSGVVIFVGCLVGAVFSAIIAYPWARNIANRGLMAEALIPYVVVAAFLLALVVLITMFTPLDSSIATIFVCTADDPSQCARVAPALHQHLSGTWPAQFTGQYNPASPPAANHGQQANGRV